MVGIGPFNYYMIYIPVILKKIVSKMQNLIKL